MIEPGQITVRQLIAKLQALPAEAMDLPVFAEGCDCTGPASGIEMYEEYDYTGEFYDGGVQRSIAQQGLRILRTDGEGSYDRESKAALVE